ncbi:MAG: hypothetical protein F6K31_08665 [Symploca sp. SIO2G7]|nr:hypothetical protein [Symploca sp. SIO2G7]
MSKLEQIVKQIEALPGEQVKAIVLAWLTASDGRFEDFAVKLAEDTDIDTTLGFPDLTAEEMRQEDMQRWENYLRTGHSISQEQVAEWLDNIGTDHELPCPK